MEPEETENGSGSTLVHALMRLGEGALLVGMLLIFGSPGFVAAGVGATAIPGLGVVAAGLLSYLLGRLVLRSSASEDADTAEGVVSRAGK
ncbi:MAG: hypothetical protein ABEH78_06175 [Haloferacaceae archaeon]